MFIFIDTETTGLSNARLVQIAWIIYDKYGSITSKKDYIIKPDGFEIPLNSTKIHGITNNLAINAGKAIQKVFQELISSIKLCEYVVGHNLEYDLTVLRDEIERLRLTNPFVSKFKICTMKCTTEYCAIQGEKGNKWPSLDELYQIVFKTQRNGKHNAVLDIEATAKCFWHLKNNKLVDFFSANSTLNISNNLKASSSKTTIIKQSTMSLKEHAIQLRGFLEFMKLSDSISVAQIEKLHTKIDELINMLEETDDDFYNPPVNNNQTSGSSVSDDLPF